MPRSAPRRLWVEDVLDRCVRLSFHENIMRTLTGPAARFQELMPPRPEPPTSFKYAAGSPHAIAAGEALSGTILTLQEKLCGVMGGGGTLGARQPASDIITWLESGSHEEEETKRLLLDAAMHCLLLAGTTPTHLSAMIGRYMPLLKFLGVQERANAPLVRVSPIAPDNCQADHCTCSRSGHCFDLTVCLSRWCCFLCTGTGGRGGVLAEFTPSSDPHHRAPSLDSGHPKPSLDPLDLKCWIQRSAWHVRCNSHRLFRCCQVIHSPAALINYVFSDSNLEQLERSHWCACV
jgi:hypothetical protein